MIDYFEEIISTLKQNKLRAIMTGFSVSWGIFMLIILLGSGKGLEHGMEYNFSNTVKNSIWVYSGKTSESYDGLKAGRRIQFTNEDYDMLKQKLSGIDNISGRLYLFDELMVTYKNEYGKYNVTCVMPEFGKIKIMDFNKGRFLNYYDTKYFRKVAVVSEPIVDVLMKGVDKPVGKYIKLGGIPFKIVGVFTDPEDKKSKDIYIPLSTGQRVFNGGNKIRNLAISTEATTVAGNKKIENQLRNLLARKHRFSVDDKKAIYVNNTLEHFKQAQGAFAGINGFIWVIGVMTIIAGIVGVSNIMIILVKERTKEIGIRKAIGASPGSVVRLILSESILITSIAGFTGLLLGMGVLFIVDKIVSKAIENGADQMNYIFNHPSADFNIAITATLVLILAGLIAGYVPAKRAAAIKPIEALHDE
ncbi:MAG: ABC transporter permease [Chlorobi bacterium]|nr:ABC transporter permease [Chlorobiota bacterium]